MIYLASYKCTRPGIQGLFNRLVRWGTQSIYSHSEICVGDPFTGPVPCISAVGTEGGVRGKLMQLSPDKWDIVALPWVPESSVFRVFAAEQGKEYDYKGLLRFGFPWLPEMLLPPSESRRFCSDLCAHMMGLDDSWRYSPAEVHDIALAFSRGGE